MMRALSICGRHPMEALLEGLNQLSPQAIFLSKKTICTGRVSHVIASSPHPLLFLRHFTGLGGSG